HDRAAYEVNSRFGEICNFHFPDIDTGRINEANRLHCKKFATQNALITTSFAREISSQDFMAIFRAKSCDRFSEEEHHLAEFLMPHMVEAGRINRLLWLNQMTTTELARHGARAISGLDGVLYTYDGEFVNSIRMEWPEWLPPTLPQQLLSALQASSGHRFTGARIVVGASLIRDMLFLRARQRSNADALTPAERTVANLVAHGRPYKEVARNLGISLATVRNQLHSVYQKLGISNKASLAQCLSEAEME
ncbi:MAG: LuxR C-terminal-related transcriptional regulator, partial [Sulfurimicrobium sp.]|nr:LuxR C-terminal-related transcriptional regulator [Sulfurimicrobium sp.]